MLVLVDTGQKTALKALLNNFKRLQIDPTRIRYIILTHTHYDHCQNAAFLQQLSGCKIIGSKNEHSRAINGYSKIPGGTSTFFVLLSAIGQWIGKIGFSHQPFKMDLVYENDLPQELHAAGIRTIATPGHSEGSLSVIVDNELAIVGDTLFGILNEGVLPPFADNKEAMLNSWATLLSTPCVTFLPGHGKAISRERLIRNHQKYGLKN